MEYKEVDILAMIASAVLFSVVVNLVQIIEKLGSDQIRLFRL